MLRRQQHLSLAHDVELSLESGVLDDEKVRYRELFVVG
jgi:hypothetical protein